MGDHFHFRTPEKESRGKQPAPPKPQTRRSYWQPPSLNETTRVFQLNVPDVFTLLRSTAQARAVTRETAEAIYRAAYD